MEQLITIRTHSTLDDLELYLADKDIISFDTETTGVVRDSEIIGFSVCADVNVAYYVILAEWNPAMQRLDYTELAPRASSFLSILKGKQLIAQNAVFDCMMVELRYQVELMPYVHTDTMLLAHLLDENRPCGLKELGVAIYGESAAKEQAEMKASVIKNGGQLTKKCYELYKADSDLIALYGAKDAILTLKIFYHLLPELFDQKLDKFFYEDETMPLLRGPTYDMNLTGLKVDGNALAQLSKELQADCLEAMAFIHKEIKPHIQNKYPGTKKTNTFNIGSGQQLAWLLFEELGEEFGTLTDSGKEVCAYLGQRLPYSPAAKRLFIEECKAHYGEVYAEAYIDKKTSKKKREKKVGHPWSYLGADKTNLGKYSKKYRWVEKFLEYAKNNKLLTTYVEGTKDRLQYGIVYPNFLQHGTTSGRYSCRNPNYQNLPREDKRVKRCIVARAGNVFVGADHSQLEPRVFASQSGDERLLASFTKDEDFYSVTGVEVFERFDCSLNKKDPDFFGKLYENDRHKSKIITLSSTYGKTARSLAPMLGCSIDAAQDIIDNYFDKFPKVLALMLNAHEEAKTHGVVYNLYGRPRRIPKAKLIPELFGDTPHAELEYEWRTILNLAINHKIQSTAASIINRGAIAVYAKLKELRAIDPAWRNVKLVLQVHDELVLEGPLHLADQMVILLKDSMENAAHLPGVNLVAEPKIALNLADLK